MDNMRDKLHRLVKQRQVDDKKINLKRSKDKLRAAAKQKITTTMVGAIARCEEYFGELWGKHTREEDCNDEQLDYFLIWRECREEIFNHGNSQIRAIEKELDLYDIDYKGVQHVFTRRQDG